MRKTATMIQWLSAILVLTPLLLGACSPTSHPDEAGKPVPAPVAQQ